MTPITLKPKCWYAWQMIPGYFGEHCVPYFSPIFVEKVTPRRTGKGILQLSFLNVGYAEGVRDFHLDLQILHRSADYLLARLIYGTDPEPDRCAVISNIEFGWIEQFCPWIVNGHAPAEVRSDPEGDVHRYLGSVFFGREEL